MPVINLETQNSAPRERVFDLARSIDAHQESTKDTNERVVAGVMSGLIGPGQEVTWEARHLGVTQRLSVRITEFDRPGYFQDVMLTGAFRHMRHDHFFAERDGITIMKDRFEFSSPLGLLGRIADGLFLERYMRRLLEKRNAILKQVAESSEWQKYLPASDRGSATQP